MSGHVRVCPVLNRSRKSTPLASHFHWAASRSVRCKLASRTGALQGLHTDTILQKRARVAACHDMTEHGTGITLQSGVVPQTEAHSHDVSSRDRMQVHSTAAWWSVLLVIVFAGVVLAKWCSIVPSRAIHTRAIVIIFYLVHTHLTEHEQCYSLRWRAAQIDIGVGHSRHASCPDMIARKINSPCSV